MNNGEDQTSNQTDAAEPRLTSKKEAYITARLQYPGWTVGRLAEHLDISRTTADRYEADPVVRMSVRRAHEETRAILRRSQLRAAERLTELLDSRKESIRLQAIRMLIEGIDLSDESQGEGETSDPGKDQEPIDWVKIIRAARGLAQPEEVKEDV